MCVSSKTHNSKPNESNKPINPNVPEIAVSEKRFSRFEALILPSAISAISTLCEEDSNASREIIRVRG